ncbi:MAG: hypothetical protein OQK32_08050 [Gammaproteobacteria bacterium]|nr:hypothetical protein [Gammaproteobacteria bacterium]MCW8923851.1 hypothetical protein [Gammaproteobacteria bacterium]
MKNLRILMMIMGFVAITACASNETKDIAEDDASVTTSAEAGVMKEEQPAAMAEEKAEAKVEETVEQTEAKAEAAEAATDASGNLVSTCKHGDRVRLIKVIYDNPETGNTCEVSYEKSSGVQTLWSAMNERDYCLGKAKAFVEKQEGWGWTCSNLE